MAIYNMFSKRMADATKAGQADVYQYTEIPNHLRVQIQQIALEALGQIGQYGGYGESDKDNPFWLDVEKTFKRERGINNLQQGEFAGERVVKYMSDCSTDDWLDLLELVCVVVLVTADEHFYRERHDWKIPSEPNIAIQEVNYRLLQASVGFQFEDGQLGSGLVDHSQKMTVAAKVMAEKKAVGQRS